MRPVVRPAVASDFIELTGKLFPYRSRAWSGVLGEEILGIGGIAYMPDNVHGVFFLGGDKARQYPVTLHKAGLMVLKTARQLGIRKLVTYAEPDVNAAERWLERLGFKPTMIDQEQEVWVWEQH